MKTLYIDCGMGAAGDMLTAALIELMPDAKAAVRELNDMGIPGVEFKLEPSVKCGITGSHMHVLVNGQEEEVHDHHEHHHDHHHHDHEHEHHHHHSSLHDIEHVIGHLNISDSARNNAIEVYKLIAEAESNAHGMPVSEIHFHEVGTMDAVADVTAVCVLLEKLGVENIVASPVHVGSGHVHCAHGILPVPAPATAHILRDVPIYSGSIDGELCTPTGAALLKHFVTTFGKMPVMRVSKIGYGMGHKDFEMANCVRVMLGETDECHDDVVKLECNMDDITGEAYAFATEELMNAGALDVFTTQIMMKKGRPGLMMTVLAKPSDADRLAEMIFKLTTTIGIRKSLNTRYTLSRRESHEELEHGSVRTKISEGYGVTRTKLEYDDIATIARDNGISLDEASRR